MYFNFFLKITLILFNLITVSNAQEKCDDENIISLRLNCFGMFKFENGDQYEGYWKNNLFHGEGKYSYTNGDTYEGNWVKGKKNGYGIFSTVGNDKYIGFFKNNLFDGYGVFTRNDPNSNQLITAILKSPNSRYEGFWKEGKFNGFGKLYYIDDKTGNEFLKSGLFKNSKLQGKGYEIRINLEKKIFNKDIYLGNFLNNKKDGYGHLFLYNFNEKPKLTYLHSEKNLVSVKIGHFRNDNIHGIVKDFQCKGLLKHFSDNKCLLNFIGSYKNGNKDGLGRLITLPEKDSTAKISIYEGGFKKNKKFGYGVTNEIDQDNLKFLKKAELFKKDNFNIYINESNFKEIWIYDKYFGLIKD